MTLKPTEREVLRDLCRENGHGDNIQTNISENIDRTPKSVASALCNLEEKGLIVNKSRGVYRLTEDGREVSERLSEVELSLPTQPEETEDGSAKDSSTDS